MRKMIETQAAARCRGTDGFRGTPTTEREIAMKNLIGISLVMVMAFAGSASAALFGEDFEGSLGQFGGGPHAASGGGNFTFGITSGNTYFSIADPTGGGHGNVLRFKDAGNTWGAMAANLSAATTDAITFTYDIFFPLADIENGNTALSVASRTPIGMNARWKVETDGTKEYRVNNGNSLVFFWTPDTWYNVELNFPSVASGDTTYTIKVTRESDSAVIANTQSQNFNAQPTSYTFMEFTGGVSAASEHVTAYLDNLSIDVVPEPASLGLMVAGGLCLLCGRRRRS